MKITKPKHPITIAIIVCVLLSVLCLVMRSTSDWRARRSLKRECGAGMDCVCFANVIDNRFNKDQIRAFRAFLTSVKKRPTTNILEFTDEASARGISEAVSLCRPAAPAKPKKSN